MRAMLVFAITLLLSSDNRVTIRVPFEPGEAEEVAVVTFDPNRISAEDVKGWMKLAEEGYYSSPHHEASLVECKPGDLKKLEQDIAKNRQIVEDLDPTKYPPELSEVVKYLNRLQAFWLWKAEQRLVFLQTGAIPLQYAGVNLACDAVVDRVHRESSEPAACHAFNYDWQNCALKAVHKQLGSYPKQQWKAFLDAYDIQERVESTVPD